jgi:hypothetical protein
MELVIIAKKHVTVSHSMNIIPTPWKIRPALSTEENIPGMTNAI